MIKPQQQEQHSLHYLSQFMGKGTYNITTLGNFRVMYNGNDLTDTLSKSLKVWELFKYFLTFRDELILPEKIIQSLWPEADYVDPKRTLRALIFRLRKALDPEEHSDSDSIIVSSRGCYKFESKECCNIDVVLFEDFFRSACEAARYDNERAIDLFKQAIEMYKGDYLSETYGYDWLIPPRNYYRRIFLQSVYEACELLKEQKRYQEITQFCEASFKYELFEEDLHLFYIEALAGIGKLKQARSHYEYVKDLFERELGVQPSKALTQAYSTLFGETSRTCLDMNHGSNGPMLCNKDFFKALQQLETRRAERYGPRNFLGLLTLSLPDHTLPRGRKLEEGMKQLRDLLLSNLRKGDVITEWSEAQFLLNFPAITDKQAEIALKRIQKKFAQLNTGLTLHYKVQTTQPVDA